MPEVFHSRAIGIHHERVVHVHNLESLSGTGVKLTKPTPLFPLAKPINYLKVLDSFFEGLTRHFYAQHSKISPPPLLLVANDADRCLSKSPEQWAMLVGGYPNG
jgi:hypothetical protein